MRPGSEPTWLSGDRFEAAVSANRKLVDIVDRKENRTFIVLDAKAVEELRDLCQEVLEFMGVR